MTIYDDTKVRSKLRQDESFNVKVDAKSNIFSASPVKTKLD